MTMQGGKRNDIGCSQMTLDYELLGIFQLSKGVRCDVSVQLEIT